MSHRVIVCDDEPHIVRAISLKFRRAGFDVYGAPDAESAWELLHKSPAAILITDYDLPRMNGADLVRMIRNDAALCDLPVIMLTARSFDLADSRDVEGELGLAAVINKPFSPRELVIKVWEVLGSGPVPRLATYASECDIPSLSR